MSKVLLVDSHDTMRKITKIILSSLGCEVEQAENGTIALQKAKQDIFDIYFIGVGLPDMLGTEVMKSIRKNKGDAVIIVVTAHTGEETKQDCLKAGANEVLHLPVLRDGYRDLLTRYKVI